jgi:hypothetical protein
VPRPDWPSPWFRPWLDSTPREVLEKRKKKDGDSDKRWQFNINNKNKDKERMQHK